ncbi:hypothetical protein OFN51_39185, partial [Escherichia coli]|nr:hypothetical protein [Escherichia coli]
AKHGRNTFDYGYIGKFEQTYNPIYITSVDPNTNKTGTRLVFYQAGPIKFTPSDKNPIAAKYTSEYFRLSGSTPTQLQSIVNG